MITLKIMGSNTKYTSQHIDNQSFDETFQVSTVEIVARNAGNTAVEYVRPATEEKQDALIGNYALKLDDTSTANVTYVGKAAIGSSGASAVWQIKKIDETSGIVITWAGGDSFTNVWDDRTTLTYL